jgi:hypothetical protein
VFFVIALFFVYRALQKQREIKDCNGCKVMATVMENKYQAIGGGALVFYPVYLYDIDGEKMTYQGRYPSMSTMQLGEQVALYYNHRTRKPVESVSVVGEVVFAMVFCVASMFLLCI